MVRFSRARPSSTSAAFILLRDDLTHREEFLRSGLLTNSASNVLTTSAKRVRGVGSSVDKDALLAAYCQRLPHTILGRDQLARPVLYRGFHSSTSFDDLFKMGLDLNALCDYNQWMLERCLEIMDQRGQWMVIVDLSDLDWHWHLISGFRYIRMLMNQDALHYPERLGQVFVINTPAYMQIFWRQMKYWIDAKTRERITFYGGSKEWHGPLSEVMDLRLLPKHLGGEAKLEPNFGMQADVIREDSGASGLRGSRKRGKNQWLRLLVVTMLLMGFWTFRSSRQPHGDSTTLAASESTA